MRAFAAIPVPDPLRESVEALSRGLSATLGGGSDWSFSRTAALHLTVGFFGKLELSSVPVVIDLLSMACRAHAPFELELGGLGAFPQPERPRVLWLGALEGREEATALGSDVVSRLRTGGFLQEDRPFTPHLTLARARERRHPKSVRALVESHAATSVGRFLVSEVVLYRSELGRGGAVHTPIATVPLTASPPTR